MKKNKKIQKPQRIVCPIDCSRCKDNGHCIIYIDIKNLKAKLKQVTSEKEKNRINELLAILDRPDKLEDLHGKKKERR